MKKLIYSLMALLPLAFADAYGAQITSDPSPAVSNKPLVIRITGQDLGSEVYCYSWYVTSGMEKSPWGWNDVHQPKFRFSSENGAYVLNISNIQEFYGMNDSELESLTKLGFIAKNSRGDQTDDLFIEVVQGRRDAYSGGEGTADSPFILKTADDLKSYSLTPGDWATGCYTELGADIDASVLTSTIGTKSAPFRGNFNGAGHSIKNLNLTGSNIGDATGLFGVVDGGEISNLGVIAGEVRGTTYVGLLAGLLQSGTVSRCFSTGSVTGSSISVGGLVGENVAGTISNCYSGASVSNPGDYATGGLVGKNAGLVQNAYAAGAVEGHDYVGGLVGANYGSVRNSVALNGSINGRNDFVARFGGNNNPQNDGDGNLSWNDIPAVHSTWTLHGDHAETYSSKDLKNKENFQTLTGWDFDDIWEWRNDMNKEYPALQAMENQHTPLSDEFYITSVGVDAVTAADGSLTVGPNPTAGPLLMRSANGIAGYSVYSLDGAILIAGNGDHATETSVDLSAARPGLYLLRVADGNGQEILFKIIKK